MDSNSQSRATAPSGSSKSELAVCDIYYMNVVGSYLNITFKAAVGLKLDVAFT